MEELPIILKIKGKKLKSREMSCQFIVIFFTLREILICAGGLFRTGKSVTGPSQGSPIGFFNGKVSIGNPDMSPFFYESLSSMEKIFFNPDLRGFPPQHPMA